MRLLKNLLKNSKIKFPLYKIFLAMNDFILIVVSLLISLKLKYNVNEINVILLISLFVVFPVIKIFIFQYNKLYKRQIVLSTIKQCIQMIKSTSVILIATICFIFLIRIFNDVTINHNIFLYYYLISFSLLILSRLMIKVFFKIKFFKELFKEKVLIIGTDENAKLLATKLLEEEYLKSDIVGFVDEGINNENKFQDIKVIGVLKNLDKIIKEEKINSIYISSSKLKSEDLHRIVEYSLKNNSFIHASVDQFKIISKNVNIDKIKDLPIIRLTSQSKNLYNQYLKRIIDFIVSLLLLLILSPILLCIFLLVKITSPGPAIFSQQRIGLNGDSFKFYKFRSMIVGSHKDKKRIELMKNFIKQEGGNRETNTKVVNHLNITPIGRFIRKYSLDELPQLFNVLIGNMSLIGPRPCIPYEYENYKQWQKLRFNSLPGCTGLWQVTCRSKSNYDEMVILDIYYNNNISIWIDLQILLKTIPTIIKGSGGI